MMDLAKTKKKLYQMEAQESGLERQRDSIDDELSDLECEIAAIREKINFAEKVRPLMVSDVVECEGDLCSIIGFKPGKHCQLVTIRKNFIGQFEQFCISVEEAVFDLCGFDVAEKFNNECRAHGAL